MDELYKYFLKLDDINLKEHIDVLKHINFEKKDYEKYIKFCHKNYNRIKLDEYSTDKFEIMILCWNKDQESNIHDHPNNGCILKILDGKIIEEVYDNKLKLIKKNLLETDDISYKEKNKIIHKIIPLEKTISLHIYSPPNYISNNFD